MSDTPNWYVDRLLQRLDELIRELTAVDSGVAKISDDTWAIYGVIAVDGDVILAEFGSYDEARAVFDRLPAGSQGDTTL
jgi:hypothetical protein